MKRWILVFLLGLCLVGCTGEGKEPDYSGYGFTDVNWTRDSGHDIETIRFSADGSFYYSCACGNPVNDADLCEGYTYHEETNEITLDYIELTEDMVTTIQIVQLSEELLELDFNGEIRTFEREIRLGTQ